MNRSTAADDLVLGLTEVVDLPGLTAASGAPLGTEDIAALIGEADRFCAEVLAPGWQAADREGAAYANGRVTVPAQYHATMKAWIESGWQGVSAPESRGGQGLPHAIWTALCELASAADMAFFLGPLLTAGAIDCLERYASEDQKQRWLPKLVTGAWPGTMNLTEPQAGSDLAALRTRAEPAPDGTYRVIGQKIYITYGEHDLTDNIVHLVLARLPNAPRGTRGISLFLVPKVLPDGTRNDVRCNGIEHKLGIHASPTCTMIFGDHGGAIGWLIGEENRGLNCMFTMMNNARLNVGIQGVAIAERAYQQALAYAHERRQGRVPGSSVEGMSPIVEHPDVRRNLLTMKALTHGARAICYVTAAAIDRAHLEADPQKRRQAGERASLLTPIAKAFSTDIGVEVASIGVQVHGGMGFVEETGAAQHLRDARILPIYEGTNGIQAIDLVTRKLPLSGGATARAQIASMRGTVTRLIKDATPAFGLTAPRLREAVESLDRATSFMLKAVSANAPDDALAGAAPYLRLFALAQGGALLADAALAASAMMSSGDSDPAHPGRIALCRFFAETVATGARGLEEAVTAGAGSQQDAQLALAS
jgi:acyl-CoA dehydrogenase